jgi:hypothetical protein
VNTRIPHTDPSERGASLPMLALGLAVLFICAALIVGVAGEASRRAHAQAAADAVALAGAAAGEQSARDLADKYPADLLSFTIDGSTVRVVLLADGITAVARAERHLVRSGGG